MGGVQQFVQNFYSWDFPNCSGNGFFVLLQSEGEELLASGFVILVDKKLITSLQKTEGGGVQVYLVMG